MVSQLEADINMVQILRHFADVLCAHDLRVRSDGGLEKVALLEYGCQALKCCAARKENIELFLMWIKAELEVAVKSSNLIIAKLLERFL